MKLNIQLFFSGVRHPQTGVPADRSWSVGWKTQGKVERFHGALELARRRRGLPEAALRQHWLDAFRHEYNHLRPHEALGMKTPASLWHRGSRVYSSASPAWQYPDGAEVHRLDPSGRLRIQARNWQVCGPLAGEHVHLVRIDQRVLVFYRHTLVRELDLAARSSTAVEPPRGKTQCVKDVQRHFVKDVVELDS